MTNRELIKKLIDFPMDVEVIIDNDIKHGKCFETKSVAFDNDREVICITNYN